VDKATSELWCDVLLTCRYPSRHVIRMKNLSVEPYGGPEQDGQIKVDNGPKLNRNLELKEEDNDQV